MLTPVRHDNRPIVSAPLCALVVASTKFTLDPVVAAGCRVGPDHDGDERWLSFRYSLLNFPPTSPLPLVAALGVITGLGPLAASSCCMVPVVLGGLRASAGVSTVFGALAALRVPLMTASVLAVAFGWFLYARRSLAACGPESSCTAPLRSPIALVLLSLAAVLIGAASADGSFEPALIKMLRGDR